MNHFSKAAVVLFFFVNMYQNVWSQEDPLFTYHLTHEMSAEEKAQMQNLTRAFIETPAPVGSVRSIAEWEPMESVLIAYDGSFGMPVSMIREMAENCKITVIVANASEETTVRNLFTSNSVNLSQCSFLYQNPNSWWTRDYSPWYIAVNDEEVALIDFPYNRPRPNDDNVPVIMAPALNVDLYGMNITHTGGNFMCDGYSMAVSTDLVWEENTSQSEANMRTKMLNYMGIQTYHVTADPLDDYIKHVDCWGKYLDVDKILIAQVPVSDYRYADFEAVATYFSQQNCSWGYPYQVIRVQEANVNQNVETPYTNSLILNDKVFVPQTGNALDAAAITTYQQAMPGYEIIGVTSSGWYDTDALHCRTHGIADREMLYIQHYPLHGTYANQSSFTINAKVTSYGGSPIAAGFPKLVYKQNDGTWTEVVMSLVPSTTQDYTAEIPGLAGLNEVKYYITAQNNNQRNESHPQMGSFDPHIFNYTNTLGIDEADLHANVQIFPNPNVGIFVLKTTFEHGVYQILNVSGQLISEGELKGYQHTLSFPNLTNGIYLIKVVCEGAVYTEKLLIE
jgi:agmatine deiminase